MKFYYVYILHNAPKDFMYVGYSEDLKQQIASHNKGENESTKAYIPLELIHYEAYKNIEDAKRREEYLKSSKGKTLLETMLREYFEENSRPSTAKTCPICGGAGKAANDMSFYRGNRYSKNITLCLTCMGKGWIESENKIKELQEPS